jgi:hypothetical protein
MIVVACPGGGTAEYVSPYTMCTTDADCCNYCHLSGGSPSWAHCH